MTDHGGAASPRTKPTYCEACTLLENDYRRVIEPDPIRHLPGDHLYRRAEAAQEAPAPEGLRAALLEWAGHRIDNYDKHDERELDAILAATPATPVEPNVHHEGDGCGPSLAHVTALRAEARPPEGLDTLTQAVIAICDEQHLSIRTANGAEWFDRRRFASLLAARLSAGGATKP